MREVLGGDELLELLEVGRGVSLKREGSVTVMDDNVAGIASNNAINHLPDFRHSPRFC